MLKSFSELFGSLKVEQLFKLNLAFILGFVLSVFFGFSWIFFIVFIVLFFTSIFGFFVGKFSLKIFLALFLAFGLGYAYFFVYDFSFRVRALKFDGTSAFVVAKVVDVKKREASNESYVLKIEQLNRNRLFLPVFVNIHSEKNFKLFYGDRIESKIYFLAKSNHNKLMFNSSRARSIYLNGKILQIGNVEAGKGFLCEFFKARTGLIDAVDFAVDEPANFLVSSIFLGQGSKIPYDLKRCFDCCGLSHIFAVSGLHISILFACLCCCLRFLRIPKWLMVFILVFSLCCFNVLLGLCVSAIRASLMNFAYFCGTLFGKKLNPVYLLSFVATIILMFLPGSIFSCSFVLSFSSCLGILLFFRRISFAVRSKFLVFSGLPKLFIELISLSVSAMVFSSFFLVLFFGKISLVAPIVNLIVMPFIPLILVFSGLVAVSGFLGLSAISIFFGYFCEGIFFVIIALAKFFAKLPFSFVPTRYFFVYLVVGGLIVFLSFVFLYARRLLFSKIVIFFCSLIVLVPVLNNFVLAQGSSSVSLIGNGAGFSTVINSIGKVIVMNCGGFGCEKNLCNFLDSRGIKKIDFLIFLSNDRRNMNCDLKTIVDCVDVFCVIMPYDKSHEHLVKVLSERNTYLIFAEQAHYVNFPVSIDFLKGSKSSSFNCHIDIGGLSFSYSLSESEFKQMQNLRFANVAFVDDYVKNYDESWNCGFLISTKPNEVSTKNFYSVLPDKISDFLIYGGYIKRMSL